MGTENFKMDFSSYGTIMFVKFQLFTILSIHEFGVLFMLSVKLVDKPCHLVRSEGGTYITLLKRSVRKIE